MSAKTGTLHSWGPSRLPIGRQQRIREELGITNNKTTEYMMSTLDKQKLPRFTGDELEDSTRHCRTCMTIWEASGQNDEHYWLKAFPATLRGMAID